MLMCFKKRKKITIFTLSDEAIEFIRLYLLNEYNINSKIDIDILNNFLYTASVWESDMVDENGYDKEFDYPEKERNEKADRFVTEISARLSSDNYLPDLEDLNKRLGFI